ncbi:MAG TPA: 2-dehydropantoate 2-reductase [Aestuariivirgaceae bacterium]|nr:2-dehydropantoate 2-reductase [Aestuariivirgaceae bacterium]
MKIAVVGAGGVGASFGALLAQAGHEVALLARGAHLDAIRAKGLLVERAGQSRALKLAASDNAADLGPADVVLFAVKLWSTEEAGEACRPLVGPRSMVVVLQNGVDGIARLSPILGSDRIVGGVAQISAVIEKPGHVVHRSPFARLIAGEPAGGQSDRVRNFVEACRAAGIEARASDDISLDLWAKFVMIVGLSGATALLRAPIGPILADSETRAFLVRLVEETVAVGRAEGVGLPVDQAERTLSFMTGLPVDMRASMLDDLERASRIEMPWLSGHVLALGERHGINTPANRTVRLALKLHAAGRPSVGV